MQNWYISLSIIYLSTYLSIYLRCAVEKWKEDNKLSKKKKTWLRNSFFYQLFTNATPSGNYIIETLSFQSFVYCLLVYFLKQVIINWRGSHVQVFRAVPGEWEELWIQFSWLRTIAHPVSYQNLLRLPRSLRPSQGLSFLGWWEER